MSPEGTLSVVLQNDGDVIIHLKGRDSSGVHVSAEVEFCDPGAGGGRSPETLAALRELAAAIERDNRRAPI
jgi:hypothetical protein